MLSNANAKQCYLQQPDHFQCIDRATLPIGVNDGGKEKTSG